METTKELTHFTESDSESSAFHVVQELLPSHREREFTPLESCRVATLEQRVPHTVSKARQAGVDIQYLGISALFSEARVYAGETTDWVFGPAGPAETHVPRAQLQALQRLIGAGLALPLLYIAHEIPKGTVSAPAQKPAGPIATMDRVEAQALVGPVPPPQESIDLANRLNRASHQVLAGLAKAGRLGATAAAAPFALVGAAANVLSSGLDPIVIGAVTTVGSRQGDPAAWWVLTRWEW